MGDPALAWIGTALASFCFGYPFVMAWYWMAGGLLFRWLEERDAGPAAAPAGGWPPVSVLVPCFNEADQIAETIGALAALDYPDYEIVAVDDASTDGTAAILERLAAAEKRLRIVRMPRNGGKALALDAGALAARHAILVCVDGDTLLDPDALRRFAARFAADRRLGAITGNPRIRNRGTLLGRLQIGEFSSIVGMIKRAQTVYGALFTVSGCVCAFRRRALLDAGYWRPDTPTDDLDVTWRIQLAGWRARYEPAALAWILMPETLAGLWRQRLRWAKGSVHILRDYAFAILRRGGGRMVPVFVNAALATAWAFAIALAFALWLAESLGLPAPIPGAGPIPQAWGVALGATYLLQAWISLRLEDRYERGIGRQLFWVIWYPLAFWSLQAATVIVAVPAVLLGGRDRRAGVWTSPDRGFR